MELWSPPTGSLGTVVNSSGDIGGCTPLNVDQAAPYLWPGDDRRTVRLLEVGDCVADLNDHGTAVFNGNYLDAAHRYSGFVWRAGRLITLARPDWVVRVEAVNEHDQVAGTVSPLADGNGQAFVWSQGRYRDLPTPPGWQSWAIDLNDLGDVVGKIARGETARAVVWHGDTITELGDLGGDTFPETINGRGDVIGVARVGPNDDQPTHPVLWRGGVPLDLLAGTGTDVGSALALGDAGQVAGEIGLRPVVWLDGEPRYLAGPDESGIAEKISTRGEVAGTIFSGTGSSRGPNLPFTWYQGKTTVVTPPSAAGGGGEMVGIDVRGRIAVEYLRSDGRMVIARSSGPPTRRPT